MKRCDLVEATVRRNKHGDNPWGDLPDPTGEFLPDEPSDDWRAAANDLRERVAKLENQVMQQYTAMAAYATIAQKNIEALQSEARSDLDRSQSTTIGLIERVRRETNEQVQALRAREAAAPGGLDSAATERLQILEQRFEALATALERSIQNQCVLAEQLATLLDERMQREGWLVSTGTVADLSLR
jgi:DNA repair exonuclease SbcCD ATPase subunit